jgi:molybdate transport system substrate-binding protein
MTASRTRPHAFLPALLARSALLTLAALPAGGCSRNEAAAKEKTLVFAAASLAAPFQAIEKVFEGAHPGVELELNVAGTPQLVAQVREGAAVDVFASADMANMQKLVDSKQTASPPVVFARNRLVIVTAPDNPKGIRSLADLANKELRVLLCSTEVPAGRYAREALGKAKVIVQPASDEPSVKAVVSKVQLGEADAGIVYVTDAASAGSKVGSVAIPDEQNVVATYPIAVLSVGRNQKVGEQFVAFVMSADGQEILHAAGFQSP